MYIHCNQNTKREALAVVKKQLITHEVKPKLILMFDANISWAKQNDLLDAHRIEQLCQVYNCELPIEILDDWEDWQSIETNFPPPDQEVTASALASLFEDEEAEEEEERDVSQEMNTNAD